MTGPTSSNSSREQILRRIADALPGRAGDIAASHAGIARRYQRLGVLSREECLELFIDRLLDYDAEVLQVEDEGAISQAVAQALAVRGEQSLLAVEALPSGWLPFSVKINRDSQLTKAQLALELAVITTCEAAVASTGTIFLVHEGSQGRRVMTLLPDHHICLVRRDQVHEDLSHALADIGPNSRKPITTISGPSATSDIEMTRIRGVHGPRRLSVVLYGPL